MRALLFGIVTLFAMSISGQNNSILFGNNSYINIGNIAGNGLRTIEMWIRPSTNINSSLSEFQIPIQRNTDFCGNCDEFAFVFDPTYSSLPTGFLRFKVHNANGVKYEVFSDTNYWQAGRWYHIAGVIDPVQGMMLFVDGVKQISTEPNYTAPTTTSSAITVIGAQGNLVYRQFYGEIDEVRFSSNARYTSNFVPLCELSVDSITTSLYKMDTIINNKIRDLARSQSGIVNAVTISNNVACNSLITDIRNAYKINANEIHLYPNPFEDILNIETTFSRSVSVEINIHDLSGKLLYSSNPISMQTQINTSAFSKGFYLMSIRQNGELIRREKLVKH